MGLLANTAKAALSMLVLTHCADFLRKVGPRPHLCSLICLFLLLLSSFLLLFKRTARALCQRYLQEEKVPTLQAKVGAGKEETEGGVQRKRGWFVLVGCYTEPRQADPFLGVGGVPHDESRVGSG